MEENFNENAVNDTDRDLHTTILPGTEIMRDVGGRHFVRAGEKIGGGQVLVPQPSNDPHDPLNWSPTWKRITVICGSLLSFSLNLGPLANAPLFEAYIQEWDCSLADAVQFTGVAILVLGFSNFIWIPMSTCFGRRPVMILSSLICATASIWRALATSYNHFMGASVLNGIGAGPCETLMPQIIADVIFLHDRGKYQTLYFTTYFGSLMIGPTIAGAMADHYGWRSFWWFNTGLLFFVFALGSFMFPETRYVRHNNSQVVTGGPRVMNGDVPAGNNSEVEVVATMMASSDGSWLCSGRPSKKQFQPWGEYQGSLLRELWLPWYLHIYPIVEFAAFAVSFSASGFLLINLTQQQALSPPPYNFSPRSVGLTNIAILIGGLIGLLTSGPLSDWVADRLTKRNNGIREPEMRLLAGVPYIFIMILGCVVTAVGYDYNWPWEVVVVVGYGCLGIQVTSLPSIASTYAIDSYKPVTGSIFVTITINKNIWGYGFSKFITPWAERSGFIPPMLTTMALITFSCSTGLLFWYWGKYFRTISKDSSVHSL